MADSNNKYRLSKLLVDGGTYFCKELLKKEIDNAGFVDFTSFLNDVTVRQRLNNLHARNILKQSQIDILYPVAGTADIEEPDITLLTCMLLNCLNTLPLSMKTSIVNLREMRNCFYGHTSLYQLDDTTFKQQWTEVSSFLKAQSLSQLSLDCATTITKMIKEIEGEILTPVAAETYLREQRKLFEEQGEVMKKQNIQMKENVTFGIHGIRRDMKRHYKQIRQDLRRLANYQSKTHSSIQQDSSLSYNRGSRDRVQEIREGRNKSLGGGYFKGEETKEGTGYMLDQAELKKILEDTQMMLEYKHALSEKATCVGDILKEACIKNLIHNIEQNKTLVLKGIPGSGKTFLAYDIMNIMRKRHYDSLIVRRPDQLRKIMDTGRRFIILVDDIFGKYSIDQYELKDWNEFADTFSCYLDISKSLLIVTIRVNNFKATESELVQQKLFRSVETVSEHLYNKENLLCLYNSMKGLHMTETQKNTILKQDCHVIGFPLLCSHMNGGFKKICNLFKSPIEMIEYEIQNMASKDSPYYIVLLLTLLHNDKLQVGCLNHSVLEDVKSYHLNTPNGPTKILGAANSLSELFLRKNGDVFSFVHDSILESTFTVAIDVSLRLLIYHAPLEYLMKLSKATCKGSSYQRYLFDRFKRGIDDFSVSNLSFWENEGILDLIIDCGELDLIYRGKTANIINIIEMMTDACTKDTNLKFIKQYLFQTKPNLSMKGAILRVAAKHCQLDCVKHITGIYKNVLHSVDEKGFNSLHHSVTKGNDSLDVILFLIDAGLDPYCTTNDGSNIFHIASDFGNKDALNYIIETYPEMILTVDGGGRNALHYASKKQPVDVIKRLIKAGIDPWQNMTDGANIYHIAAYFGNVEVVRYINQNYPDMLHCVVNDGWNVLHCASEKQPLYLLELLMNLGIDPSVKNKYGENIFHIAAANGNTEVVRHITEKHAGLLLSVNIYGWNAIHFASQKQSVDMIKLLIDSGIDPKEKTNYGVNLLHIASSNGNTEVVRFVIGSLSELKDSEDNTGWNSLHYASKNQSKEMIKFLIESGTDPRKAKNDGMNIAHIASSNGNMKLVKYIIENYPDMIHTADHVGWTPLHFASKDQSLDMVQFLIESGSDVYRLSIYQESFLHIASYNGNLQVARYICEKYSSIIKKTDDEGQTPLHYASENQSVDIIEILIKLGLDPFKTGNNFENILHVASDKGNIDVVRYISENYPDMIQTYAKGGQNALHIASRAQSVDLVTLLINSGIDPYDKMEDGSNIMHLAAFNGNTQVLKFLLKNFPDMIQLVNSCGMNALHYASHKQSVDLIKLLIESGIDPYCQFNEGRNILHIASNNGNKEVVSYLMKTYSDMIQTSDNFGWNTLHFASVSESVDMLVFLLDSEMAPYDNTYSGENILHIASYHGNVNVLQYIIERFPKMTHLVDNKGWNALFFASANPIQSENVFKFLVESGIDPYVKDCYGNCILHIASSNCNIEASRYIIENYPEMIQAVNNDMWNAVHFASQEQSVDMIRFLIESGINPCDKVNGGRNILHLVALSGNIDVARHITEKYPEMVNAIDNDGKTALHFASQGESVGMVKLLIKSGLNIDQVAHDGSTNLNIAIENDRYHIVRYIGENFPFVLYRVDGSGWTSIHHAAKYGSVATVNYLIENVPSIMLTKNGQSILDIAEEYGNIDVVTWLQGTCL